MTRKIEKVFVGDVDRIIGEISVVARSDRLAARFKEVNDEMIEIVTDCSGEVWRRPCAGEGWPVGVVAHHVASVYPAFIKIVETVAAGVSLMPRVSMDRVNESNARHAEDSANVSQDEVLACLRTGGTEIVRILRCLTDAQLAHKTSAFGGQERSLAEIVEMVVIGHSKQHLASLRATIAE